jgi:electron transfer flavoprotein beta subunit
MAAKKAAITTWKLDDLGLDPKKTGLDGSPTRVVKIFSPAPKEGGRILNGEPEEMVKEIVESLKGM